MATEARLIYCNSVIWLTLCSLFEAYDVFLLESNQHAVPEVHLPFPLLLSQGKILLHVDDCDSCEILNLNYFLAHPEESKD